MHSDLSQFFESSPMFWSKKFNREETSFYRRCPSEVSLRFFFWSINLELLLDLCASSPKWGTFWGCMQKEGDCVCITTPWLILFAFLPIVYIVTFVFAMHDYDSFWSKIDSGIAWPVVVGVGTLLQVSAKGFLWYRFCSKSNNENNCDE